MIDPSTDRERLQTEAYSDSGRLRQRLGSHTYARRHVDFASWALDQLQLPAGLRALDVGCGPGHYLQRLDARGVRRCVGIDLSVGMASEARRHEPTARVGWTAAAMNGCGSTTCTSSPTVC